MTKQPLSKYQPEDRRTHWTVRFADAIIFIGVLLLSALAIAAVAVAAPIILAVSVIAGLMFKNAPAKSWRRARA